MQSNEMKWNEHSPTEYNDRILLRVQHTSTRNELQMNCPLFQCSGQVFSLKYTFTSQIVYTLLWDAFYNLL